MSRDVPPPPAYPPPPFDEARHDVLAAFIRANPFGFLVTAGGALDACGAPFLLVESEGRMVLEGHLARSNPQARLPAGAPGLVLFQGPHAYVRPSWYETWTRDGKAVPTWDYICVQAKGPVEIVEDAAWLRPRLAALSAMMEGGFADPWAPQDAPADYMARLSRAIVGVRVEVVSLRGVWKLHQNHPLENRRGVIAGLEAVGGSDSLAIARAIAALGDDG